jgi:hypothetical protein
MFTATITNSEGGTYGETRHFPETLWRVSIVKYAAISGKLTRFIARSNPIEMMRNRASPTLTMKQTKSGFSKYDFRFGGGKRRPEKTSAWLTTKQTAGMPKNRERSQTMIGRLKSIATNIFMRTERVFGRTSIITLPRPSTPPKTVASGGIALRSLTEASD